jgi:SprT-like family
MKRAILCLLILFLVLPVSGFPSHDPQVWYAQYNEEYFWKSLPDDTEVDLVTDLPDGNMGTAVCADFHRQCVIQIEERSNPVTRSQKITLLHEMCHVATWRQQDNPHGSKWQACMHRIADRGAFDNLW